MARWFDKGGQRDAGGIAVPGPHLVVCALLATVWACQPAEPPSATADAFSDAVPVDVPEPATTDVGEVDDAGATEYEAPEAAPVKPGVSLRRLDRLAYNNTMRDLFGLGTRPADAFPADPPSFGYDNLSDHLSISPLWMEYAAQVSEQVAADVLAPETSAPFEVTIEAETLAAPDESFPYAGVGVGVYSLYPLTATVTTPADGTYLFDVRAWREKVYWTGNIAPTLALMIDGETVQEFSVLADADEPETLSVSQALTAGEHTVSVRVMNPQANLDEDEGFSGVVVAVDWFRISSSEVLVVTPSLRDSVLICSPDESSVEDCGRLTLRTLLRRLWRRPPLEAEVSRLMHFVDDAVGSGEGFEAGIQLALEASLLSPNFLFLVELPPEDEPDSVTLSSHQLAARLSHFFWSSVPDAALAEAAEGDALTTDEEVAAQAERMLDDPKAVALFDNLADQWLLARKVETIQPNIAVFDDFTSALRSAMAEEVRQFFRSFVDPNRTLFDLLTSTDLYVDDVMAKHYGLPPVGPDFVHLESHGAPRGGILRQAGVLAANSHPYRTSPTRRGQWILEKLLCTDIGAPPPGQGLFFDPSRLDEDVTETPQLLLHFTDPSCAGCHVMMDPLGLAMESYDAIGRWRSVDQSLYEELELVFDADDILWSAEQVIEKVANDPAFLSCVVRQIYTYALGRAPLPSDVPVIDALVEQLPEIDYSLRRLMVAIATSAPFRERLPEADAELRREERP
ncbi:MAG: DUF1592 domain-containing protein [Myxococcota bacterium]